MTVNDYITQKFQTFGIQLSEADLLDIVEDAELESGDIEREANNRVRVSIAIAKFIPSLLLHPNSLSEGGYSISRSQVDDIQAYYSIQCKELGIPDRFKAKTSFIRR